MNISAAVRIPRDGEFLFFGKFLDGIDSDISMHKRAREVAGRIAKPRFCNASRRQRFRSATSFSSRGRVQSFVPAVEVSAAPYAAEERPAAELPPFGPLPQRPVVSDLFWECFGCVAILQ